MTLPRGFKSKAEKEAVEFRTELGLRSSSPIDIRVLAEHLGYKVVSADDLVAIERLEELERLQAFAFSGATFEVKNTCFIVTNPLRTDKRIVSDIAHEMSHMILGHDLSEVRNIEGIPFRTCRPDEEEQATVYGGTLMLPRPLLVAAAKRGFGYEQIAKQCGVTPEMARFRFNSTGVAKQYFR